MAKNEAKIKFTAETGDFNDKIKSSDDRMRELRSELKLNAAQMKNTGKTTEGLQKKHDILTEELEASRDKTDALSGKLEKAKEIYGENSTEVKRLEIQLNNAKAAEEAIKKEIDDTNEELNKQKTRLDDVADKAGKVGDKLTKIGKGMGVVSAAIVAAGAASIAAFNEVDEGADNVIKATGATGKKAAELEGTYKKVAESVVGDFAEIGNAVGEINTRFGYTGAELKKASLLFQKFSYITGVDATQAVQSVSRALNDAGIPLDEYDSLLDQLAKAGQAAGVDVSTLADSLSQNGSIMRTMGFNTEETIALLAQFELSGANSTVMLSGMKRAMATWAKEGKNGSKEFEKVVEGVKNGSVDASDALEIFGTKAGPMLVEAIQSGKFEYNDMLKTIKDSKGTVEGTFDATVDGGYQMELALQNAKIAAGEVGNTLLTTLTPAIETATEKMKGFAGWWTELSDGSQKTILGIAGVVAAISGVLLALGALAGSIVQITALIKLCKSSTQVMAVVTKIATAAQWLWNAALNAMPIILIITAIVALIAIFVQLWKKCDWFRQFWIDLWEGIKKAFFATVEWFKTAINNVKNFFSNLWSSILVGIDKIKNGFGKVKDAIVKPFKTAIDKVKSFFKNLKLSFPKIKMPHFSIKGKFSLDPPSVPKLAIDWYAKGGIFRKPTIFSTPYGFKGVGEAGAEAVLPIDRLQGYIAGAIEKTVQTVNFDRLADSIEKLASRPIEMDINGKRFATATASDTDEVNGMRSRLIERGMILD